MSQGPPIVAVQLSRFSGEEGNAEIPGVLESINCINSVWRLGAYQSYVTGGLWNAMAVPLCHALCVLTTSSGGKFRGLMNRWLTWSGVLCVLYGEVCHTYQGSLEEELWSNNVLALETLIEMLAAVKEM